MMFVMHNSDAYGVASTDREPMTPEALARRCGCGLDEFSTLLEELDRAGVPSRTNRGAIYSRRMVRDEESRAENRKRQAKFYKSNKTQEKPNAQPNGNLTRFSRASSSSSSKQIPPLPPDKPELSFDHDMVATAVMAETASGGMHLRVILAEIAVNAIAAGKTGEQVRDLIVDQWAAYRMAIPKLEWKYGSLEKFLAGGLWHDPKLWPWKDGHGPPKTTNRVDPLAEVKAQRAAAERERDRKPE